MNGSTLAILVTSAVILVIILAIIDGFVLSLFERMAGRQRDSEER